MFEPSFLVRTFGFRLLVACFTSCGAFKLKPLSVSKPEYDCFSEEARPTRIYSQIEEDLHRSGALGTKAIKLSSGIGMIEKTAKLYVLNKRRYVIVFHFLHMVQLEIKDYSYSIRSDSKAIAGGTLHIDTKHTVGQATDEYLYFDVSEKEAQDMANAGKITIWVGTMPFDVPYECRETFRNALNAE